MSRKESKSYSRSPLKPLLALAVLVSLAIGAAIFLSRRQSPDSAAADPPSSPVSDSKPVLRTQGWTKGNPLAKTTLVEFGDFQCGACANARLKVAGLIKKYGDQLKVVFKQYPLERFHANSMMAAQAAEAAGKQHKFWEMHDILFERQTEWASVPDPHTFFVGYANDLQLDIVRFKRDLWDGQIRDKIYRDMMEGQVAQVTSVPTFFLNGERLQNVRNDTEFEQLVSSAIRAAQ